MTHPRATWRNRKVVELAKAGNRPGVIVALLAEQGVVVDVTLVYQALVNARKNGEDIPRFSTLGLSTDGGARALISAELRMQLARHADARKITVSELARRLLTVAAKDKLVDGILDDGFTAEPPP